MYYFFQYVTFDFFSHLENVGECCKDPSSKAFQITSMPTDTTPDMRVLHGDPAVSHDEFSATKTGNEYRWVGIP